MDHTHLPWDQPAAAPGRQPVLSSCSEACAGFERLTQAGWSDYGRCNNPHSPWQGAPVRVGRDCWYAVPRIGARAS